MLRSHADPEVQLQAALESARISAGNEDWDSVVAVLEGVDAAPLGPGWDASLVEVRAAAQVGQGEPDAAAEAWAALARRWPESEEALLPAWLGLADLALARGDLQEARQWADRAVLLARDPGYLDRARALVARLDGG